MRKVPPGMRIMPSGGAGGDVFSPPVDSPSGPRVGLPVAFEPSQCAATVRSLHRCGPWYPRLPATILDHGPIEARPFLSILLADPENAWIRPRDPSSRLATE